jgi:D-3-phosphoglycerate dehydrogenase
MYKVLVTSRSFGNASHSPIEILEEAGLDYTLMGADFNQEAFEEAVQEYDALVIGAHPFDAEVMKKCAKMKIICKHGAGLDNIDLEVAKALGIRVTNVPAMNSDAVADLAFGHILNLSRGISLCDRRVHNHEWKTFVGRDVCRKSLGLVGFGAIAKNVARRARGFDMKVFAYDPFLKTVPEEFQSFVELVDFETLLTSSHVISIHVPLTEETRNLFNRDTMSRMRPDALLVNTGRGGIINEKDLYDALTAGTILGAALDVTSVEPIEKDNPLLTLDNVVVTPHIGMYSLEAINAVSVVCAENVVKMYQGTEPNFVVV